MDTIKSLFQNKYPLKWADFIKRYTIYSVLLLLVQVIFTEEVYISRHVATNAGFVFGAFAFGGLIAFIIGLLVYFVKNITGRPKSLIYYTERGYLFVLFMMIVVNIVMSFLLPQ